LPPRHRWLDRQGFSTLFAGALLLLISFTTNYGDDNLLKFRGLPAAIQIGIYLHIAALAALAGVDEVFSEGVVQLATRLRHRARIRTAEDQIARERETDARKREAYEAARDRGQAARRTRIQARCLVAQCRFLLADPFLNRLQLSEALAVLLEELRLPKA